MMFTNDKPIFQQMADRLSDEILANVYHDDDRIPSVREYAVTLEVNTNTAVKAYEQLARENIIYNKRGMGYFITPGAREQILKERRQAFLKQQLPELFRQMKLLGLDLKDIETAWAEDGKKEKYS
ncbi:MAG: GntR family transcriptional regulator [Prevotella sp.]|nr:GntR family transcriptional regulator [Prevotella sp.]